MLSTEDFNPDVAIAIAPEPLVDVGEVNLTRIYPSQVEAMWNPYLLNLAKVGLPPAARESVDALRNVFMAMRNDTLQPYAVLAEVEGAEKVVGLLVVVKQLDTLTAQNGLHLWAVWGSGALQVADWVRVGAKLRQVAIDMGCTNINGYSTNPIMSKIAKANGAYHALRYMVWEV